MKRLDPSRSGDDEDPGRGTTYVAVLLVELAVVVALWAFGQYFSG